VASTSLEDVFLKINNQSNINNMIYIERKLGSQEILIPENLIEISGFFTQLISQLKRIILPIYRNKLMLLLEFFSGLGIIYHSFIIFSLVKRELYDSSLDLIDILKENEIYIYEDGPDNGVLKNSFVYDSSEALKLSTLSKRPIDVQNLIDLLYNESFENIAMGCISINQIGDKWNTYITSLNLGNLFADTILLVSAFLKREFGINAIFLNKIKTNKGIIEGKNFKIDNNEYLLLQIFCLGYIYGYIIFLGGLINEKIKERKTNIKNLLYLSGSNSWSYWISFFIIDYLKLLVFTILLMIPFFTIINSEILNFFYYFLIFNASSLVFIYFVSFFGSDEKSGIKFLFLLLISSPFIYFIFNLRVIFFSNSEPSLDDLNFNILLFTPITSMVSYLPFILPIILKKGLVPEFLISFKFIIQIINFVIYFLLLVLMENGYFKGFFNWFKLKFCLREKNFVFSKEQLPDEFLIYNKLNNKQLLNQSNFHSNKYQDMRNNNNVEAYNKMNIPLLGNNNQSNIKIEESNYRGNMFSYDDEINTSNLNKFLIQDGNKGNIINNDDEYSINKISLPQINLSYDIRKGYPDVDKEKYMLDKRNDFTTRIEGLYKTFWLCCRKNVRAINNLNLGLEANEKFGLLGFNGSGKTTTFKAITNEILYDSGKISLFGFDTRKQFKFIRNKIGYCPQENPLFDFMKVREILEFYSNLKTCFFPIEEICKNFGLTKYLDTFCINLSGGNKRKLTFAKAIMNRPSLLLLDEPSTGVDRDSRRFMWKNINELSNSGHRYNMILTTHSMEEAEVLCDRIAWLKQGRFVCIGNPEKLKIQYSLGYKLYIKFYVQEINKNKDISNIEEAFQIISDLIVGFSNYSNYIINNPSLEPYIRSLIKIVNKIKSNTKNIILAEIRKDLSFELILNIIQDKKHLLLSDILNMKNIDDKISEINISMDSLDNTLTSFI